MRMPSRTVEPSPREQASRAPQSRGVVFWAELQRLSAPSQGARAGPGWAGGSPDRRQTRA